VNVEALLRGAEKLCGVYPVAGATERIATLGKRYQQVAESVALYEEKVRKQHSRLEKMNKNTNLRSRAQDDHEEDLDLGPMTSTTEHGAVEEDTRLEEQEIRELEMKKRTLEERVTGMEKDLGGLLR